MATGSTKYRTLKTLDFPTDGQLEEFTTTAPYFHRLVQITWVGPEDFISQGRWRAVFECTTGEVL